MNKNEHRKWRLEQAEQLLASSLSVREWCKLNHVAESTMYAWLKVYREQAGETHTARNDWIEVSRTEAKQATTLAVFSAVKTTHASMRVIMNRACVEIAPGTCEADITQVLRAVTAL